MDTALLFQVYHLTCEIQILRAEHSNDKGVEFKDRILRIYSAKPRPERVKAYSYNKCVLTVCKSLGALLAGQ